MDTLITPITEQKTWLSIVDDLGEKFAERASLSDANDTFVNENYEELKVNGFLTALIPEELGGGGATYKEMCQILRKIAHYDSSTALALSMHQHLLAANVWKYKHGKGGEDVLRKVVDKQLILISTGANDWLESTGTMEKVPDGYLVSGQKDFASQSVAGNVLVTSAPFMDPLLGWQVLHFSVPMSTEGVTRVDNWYAMGMRGTGSQSVRLEKVFIPESAIVLKRARGEFHPVWNIVLTVALPLIMSVYVGIAEKATQVALELVKDKDMEKPHVPFLIGEVNNELITAQVVLKDMIQVTNNFQFEAINKNGLSMLSRKTIVANAVLWTVEKCMEVVGGKSYYRHLQLERLFRDIQASSFHPLPEKIQQKFCGDFVLKQGGMIE